MGEGPLFPGDTWRGVMMVDESICPDAQYSVVSMLSESTSSCCRIVGKQNQTPFFTISKNQERQTRVNYPSPGILSSGILAVSGGTTYSHDVGAKRLSLGSTRFTPHLASPRRPSALTLLVLISLAAPHMSRLCSGRSQHQRRLHGHRLQQTGRNRKGFPAGLRCR